MFLEIVSPEAILFSSEVDSVSVPGVNGEFQMLNNHAPIVSILKKGTVLIDVNSQSNVDFKELNENIIPSKEDKNILTLSISSGTLELNNNKLIILAD